MERNFDRRDPEPRVPGDPAHPREDTEHRDWRRAAGRGMLP